MTLEKHILSFVLLVVEGMLTFVLGNDYTIYSIGNEGSQSKFEDTRVNCIYRDTDGFIWIGTGATVERINGKNTLPYHFAEEYQGSAPSPFLVNTIIENYKHDFWVGTIQGLWHMNHSNRTLERMFTQEINFSVQVLKKNEENQLYIGTVNGLYIYDRNQLRHIIIDEKNILSPNNRILDIAICNSQSIWLLTANGLVLCDTKSGALKQYSCPLAACGQLKCLVKIEDILYLGTEKGGIITFDLLHRNFAPYWNTVKAPISSLTYEKEVLGIATAGQGLYLLSLPEKRVLYSATYGTETGQDLLSNVISSILFFQGDVWCGTNYYQGLNILRKRNEAFKRYDKGLFKSKDISVRSCFHTKDYIFIGTREGFYYIHVQTGKINYINTRNDKSERLHSNLIFSFHEYGEEIFIGTCGGGISSFNPRTGTFNENPLTRTCTSNDIFMFLEDANNKLWLATSDGLYSYDKQTESITEYNASNSNMPGNIVYGAYIDSSGRFWVGTDKGLAIFDSQTGKCNQDMLPEIYHKEAIRYIFEGRDGTLIFAQLNNKLLVTDKSLTHFYYPLPTNCHSITQDDQGYYWLGKWDGLLRVNEKMDRYTFFPAINALAANAGPPISKDEYGKLWVCGMKGLFIVTPQNEFVPSSVRITEMQVNGKLYADNYVLNPDSTFNLNSNENNITFIFNSLGYENPEQIKYEYMLEGRDSIWTELVNEDKVSYFNLPAGNYRFHVRKFLDMESVDQIAFNIKHNHSWLVYSSIAGILVIILLLFTYKKKTKTPIHVEKPEDLPDIIQKEIKIDMQPTESYVKMSKEEAKEVIDTLKKYMQEQKPYLNVDLKQSEVAVAIGYPTYLLSAIFTHYLKMGYYDFVNSYRVEQFKQSINEGQHKKYTLVTLAEKCGFKSKASFFRAFKKFTGTTPNEYIQQFDK